MLKVAAAAFAEYGAGRSNSLRRGFQDFIRNGNVKTRLYQDYFCPHPFALKRPAQENGFPVHFSYAFAVRAFARD